MKTYTTRDARGIANALASLLPFKTHGAMEGYPTEWQMPGRLPRAAREQLRLDVEARRLAYVVRSYSTPIAWAVRYPAGGVLWRVVSDKFSITTTKHQSTTRYALSIADYADIRPVGGYLDCGHPAPEPSNLSDGIARTADGFSVCPDCAAWADAYRLATTGRVVACPNEAGRLTVWTGNQIPHLFVGHGASIGVSETVHVYGRFEPGMAATFKPYKGQGPVLDALAKTARRALSRKTLAAVTGADK